MKELLINGCDISKICRLCLSSGTTIIDLFCFSSILKDQIAIAVMKCTPIQIKKHDDMPRFICQLCYTQLKKIHQFQIQVVQSDETLRHYLQKLHVPDKQPKLKSIQSSEDSLTENTKADITIKYESLELSDVFDDWKKKDSEKCIAVNKSNEKISLKTEIKDEPIDSLIQAENTLETLSKGDINEIICEESEIAIRDAILGENIIIDREQKDPIKAECTTIEEMSLKSEIEDIPTEDNSLILAESIVGTLNSSSNEYDSEINCEDTKIGIDHLSDTSTRFQFVDVIKHCDFDKKASIKHEKHKNIHKIKSDQSNVNHICSSRLKDNKKHSRKQSEQCGVCNTKFLNSIILKKHQILHTGEKPHQCDVCNKTFTYPSHLKNHKRIHTGEKPYKCDSCEKCYNRLDTLNSHKLSHTGEKHYHCDICNKTFTYSSSLKVHKRVHTGEKPYQCDVCNKCFTNLSNLNKHKLIHTGVKSYVCDICKKLFTHSYDLKRHKLIHEQRNRVN